jgi:tetratricopeptide (TPR) repeat protein
MEVGDADSRARRQVAYAFFDLTYYLQRLDRKEDARWAYERSRDLWAAATGDFEALTQLAGCHNHLGLIALDAGDSPAAESAFRAATRARETADRINPQPAERAENLVYLAGVLCNLGTLYRQRGDRSEAIRSYDQAIASLTALLPPARGPLDAEVQDLHMDMWSQIYGVPHWVRVACQFLANAQAGKAAVEQS